MAKPHTQPASQARTPSRRTALLRVAALGSLALAGSVASRTANAAAADATGAVPNDIQVPTELVNTLPGAQALGAARLRFLGMEIYAARLWVQAGFSASSYAQSPFALELNYSRSLSGKLIAERSLKEMQRQGQRGAALEQVWLDAMLRAFPDVKAGDRITGLHTPGSGARFWFNAQERAAVRDAEFSRLFFGIWLSEASSEPHMRSQLLGRSAL